ncbi:MAG: NADH-quinone oxidoreductase subunit L [Chlorobiota bacterium]|nr:NADH-quinone oxidoreductase subunit L [Chlorobiota bacterium]QQS65785.1 MAG: NADH-quinone oxidoreductase subunit L [Chlorobiota bacterium]
MNSVLNISLIILILPFVGFILQLILGKMKKPSDYIIDPHDTHHAGHNEGEHHAHSEHSTDEHHGELRLTVPEIRGPWTQSDQTRAYKLTWISTGIMGICLALSLYVAYLTLSTPLPEGKPNYYPKAQVTWNWLNFNDGANNGLSEKIKNSTPVSYKVDLGILADNLAAIMLVVVTLISFLVHLFSSEYMREPGMHAGRFNRFYAYLGIFTFSMLGIVLANNILMIYIFWELVGVSSYLLIGFWYERSGPQYANKKAFITNRVGDIGMFAGIMILYTQLGTLQMTEVFDMIAKGMIPYGSEAWLTAAGILLFCGAIGKSAQFPLNIWLPDAMEGPTPVSALIHAATMVAAGVYLTARIFPLLTGDAMLFVAFIGATTAFIAATIALTQWDMKKVLAFSTVSQLGYMVMALGVGAYQAAIFHLVTHAMFKACMFLCSGSVIHAMHHSLHHLHDHSRDPQDMRNMGGLKGKMRITFIACVLATCAISGLPLFSGYMSKDEILAGAWAFGSLSSSAVAKYVVIIGYGVAGLTAFYMWRMIFLTFFGKPKAQDIYDHIKENPKVMTTPLIILASLSLWVFYGANPLNPGDGWFMKNWVQTPTNVTPSSSAPHFISQDLESKSTENNTIETHNKEGENESGKLAVFQEAIEHKLHELHSTGIPHVASIPALLSLLVAGCGIAFAFFKYGKKDATGQQVSWDAPKGLQAFSYNRWYQDNFYEKIFPVGFSLLLMKAFAWFDTNVVDGIVNGVATVTRGVGVAIGGFDKYVIDGLVNFIGGLTQFLGLIMRQFQTGRIQTYLVYILLGVILLFFLFR